MNGTSLRGDDEFSSYEESEDEEEEEEEETTEDDDWIPWFCSQRGNEFFCEVDRDYIEDEFNLAGLTNAVEHYQRALDLILDEKDDDFDDLTDEQKGAIEESAEILYNLIHARFITTPRGLKLMYDKYKKSEFGVCPRYHCQFQSALPMGESDVPGKGVLKLFCPRCEQIYTPPLSVHKDIDGAFIGSSFPHLFLLEYPLDLPPVPKTSFKPNIFGFRLYSGSHHSLKKYLETSSSSSSSAVPSNQSGVPLPADRSVGTSIFASQHQPSIAPSLPYSSSLPSMQPSSGYSFLPNTSPQIRPPAIAPRTFPYLTHPPQVPAAPPLPQFTHPSHKSAQQQVLLQQSAQDQAMQQQAMSSSGLPASGEEAARSQFTTAGSSYPTSIFSPTASFPSCSPPSLSSSPTSFNPTQQASYTFPVTSEFPLTTSAQLPSGDYAAPITTISLVPASGQQPSSQFSFLSASAGAVASASASASIINQNSSQTTGSMIAPNQAANSSAENVHSWPIHHSSPPR
ncbi:putative casein kinase ii subunit beta [Monocercomonoides exilis]|uniref:putative casein kinase ii subunit beta n=1 Tax=Monocercomonoides exilis TaxID=2049356 RepID=UPI003559AAAC|nr:putative casein kinase ii subunit beta [Monocercomonoides exilis]|eukprot:MONOS_9125.1-p1 / transcript=MONOS_9125.1 / gene=MONOS_9125 / organism=Monocercomonoides_exilis_PA203 / gene_product=casein kinase ii subunit beta, putative / transcript_product=casein kinase ii subunit beta, putative / location=Mono_scaffold00366:47811-49648(-) / protein_length=511 / sequence_SO=supercontig / SO=protein_coding / is_pseudo=false